MAFAQRGVKNILQKYPRDVVFLSALRTPVTRSYKGGLRNAYPEQMLAAALRATLDKLPNLPPSNVQDVAVGTVLSDLGGSKAARMALNHVGFPSTTSLYTVNRACSSGLQAITSIADAIAMGRISGGIGGGMESMTRHYGSKAVPVSLWPALRDSPVKDARDCIMSMGLTSENVTERYDISRADQDTFAAESHVRASRAQREGRFDGEIVPVTVENPPVDGGNAEVETATVTKDDGIRHEASVTALAKLKPVFKPDGVSTAGNSSPVSDGAAAAVMMRRSDAEAVGLKDAIIGKWVASRVVGVAPDEMGIGPAVAIPALLDAVGVGTDDIGVWEINEAFASQSLYCIRTLGLDVDRVNPNGGAIALGHPLGATGARQLATLLPELDRRGEQLGVISMCVGTGMGMASLIVRE
ncbi:MAG: hypothetical protein M1837_004292 [Sclerophora amabilis]|nr:MAG: hypothetical protein M1837_004292 [Sclerophora amabilis]